MLLLCLRPWAWAHSCSVGPVACQLLGGSKTSLTWERVCSSLAGLRVGSPQTRLPESSSNCKTRQCRLVSLRCRTRVTGNSGPRIHAAGVVGFSHLCGLHTATQSASQVSPSPGCECEAIQGYVHGGSRCYRPVFQALYICIWPLCWPGGRHVSCLMG